MIRSKMKLRVTIEVRDKEDGHYYLVRRGDWHDAPPLMEAGKAADFALAHAEEYFPHKIKAKLHD